MTAKSQTSIWMDKIVKDHFAPILKDAGFRKRGRTFFKESEDIIKGLEIQSGWNLPAKANFTINLLFIFPGGWEMTFANSRPDNPIRIPPTVRQRMGLLMPRPSDKWWSLKKDSDIDIVGPEVKLAIIEYALPFLNEAASSSDLLNLYKQDPDNWGVNPWAQLHAAIIANQLGDKHYARRLLLEKLDEMPSSIKVVETNIGTNGTITSKEKEFLNEKHKIFIRQCAKRMAIDI